MQACRLIFGVVFLFPFFDICNLVAGIDVMTPYVDNEGSNKLTLFQASVQELYEKVCTLRGIEQQKVHLYS